MIRIGLTDTEKSDVVSGYVESTGVERVFVFSPARFAPGFAFHRMTKPEEECDGRRGLFVDWSNLIEYRYYYRLLQEIDGSSLVVVNECLRTQNRYDLTYNCIRNCLNQSKHVIVFQYLPIIDDIEDFMVLFDFATRSRWKRERFDRALLGEVDLRIVDRTPDPIAVNFRASRTTHTTYRRRREKLFAEVRGSVNKDPRVIPRNLYLVSGRDKVKLVDSGRRYVGRNNRFKLPNIETWRGVTTPGDRVVFEIPHNFVEICDYLGVTRQRTLEVLVSDTKADIWYFERLREWSKRVGSATTVLHG